MLQDMRGSQDPFSSWNFWLKSNSFNSHSELHAAVKLWMRGQSSDLSLYRGFRIFICSVVFFKSCVQELNDVLFKKSAADFFNDSEMLFTTWDKEIESVSVSSGCVVFDIAPCVWSLCKVSQTGMKSREKRRLSLWKSNIYRVCVLLPSGPQDGDKHRCVCVICPHVFLCQTCRDHASSDLFCPQTQRKGCCEASSSSSLSPQRQPVADVHWNKVSCQSCSVIKAETLIISLSVPVLSLTDNITPCELGTWNRSAAVAHKDSSKARLTLRIKQFNVKHEGGI